MPTFFFSKPIILNVIYTLISAISNIIQNTKMHTETYIYPNKWITKSCFPNLVMNQIITIQNTLIVKMVGVRFEKALFPFFSFGFRN